MPLFLGPLSLCFFLFWGRVEEESFGEQAGKIRYQVSYQATRNLLVTRSRDYSPVK